MGRIPRMLRPNRLHVAIGSCGALQAIVLDVIRQQDLHLSVGRKAEVYGRTFKTRGCVDACDKSQAAAEVQQIGVGERRFYAAF